MSNATTLLQTYQQCTSLYPATATILTSEMGAAWAVWRHDLHRVQPRQRSQHAALRGHDGG